jgi:hypothetical protein
MSGSSHFIHFIMTILTGCLWLPIWIIAALCCGSSRRKKEMDMKREELALLRKIANK